MTNADEARWRERVAKVLKGADFEETLVSTTLDGIKVQPLYPKAEEPHGRALRQKPGLPWTLNQRVDHPDAAAAGELALADLAGGADGLTLVFAGAPTAHGFGISPKDLGRTLEGVELDLIRLRLDLPTSGQDEAIAALLALLDRHRLVPASLHVDFGLDPIGAMAATGRITDDWQPPLAATASMLLERGFGSPVLRADGRVHHDAGASPAQELAAVLAVATAYLRALETAGIDLDAARRAVSFLLVADADQFATVAKFRALRRLWAAVESACGLQPKPVRLAAETSFRMATRREPAVNMLRNTTAAFAAAVGGADSIAVLPHTIALGLPDGFARRMARNIQNILLEESHLARVADPGAGSGAIEALTEELSTRAWALFQEIEAADGLPALLASGAWQNKVAETARARQSQIAAGTTPILGVTVFVDPKDQPPRVLMEAPAAALRVDNPRAMLPRRDAEPFEDRGLGDQSSANAGEGEAE